LYSFAGSALPSGNISDLNETGATPSSTPYDASRDNNSTSNSTSNNKDKDKDNDVSLYEYHLLVSVQNQSNNRAS